MRAEKAALWALTVSAVYPGLWALVWPRSFHASFPGAGLHWVSSLGPFDEHLVRDVGGFFLAFAAIGAFAATRGTRETVLAVALAWTVFQAPHVASHVTLAAEADAGTLLQLLALHTQLALAVFVLVSASRRTSPSGRPEGGSTP